MPKPIEDRGHLLEATRPLKPKVYRSDRRPDPVQCAGCLIVVCDPHDANGLHLEISDGSRWRRLNFADEESAAALIPTAPTIDVEAIKREVISRAIAEMPQPSVKVISPPSDVGGDGLRAVAQDMMTIADHVASIADQSARHAAEIDQLRGELELLKSVRVVTEVDAA